MPFDLHAVQPQKPIRLSEAALELMLRAQIDPTLDAIALRAELRSVVVAARRPAEDLWEAYAAGRVARRSLSRGAHARVTIAGA